MSLGGHENCPIARHYKCSQAKLVPFQRYRRLNHISASQLSTALRPSAQRLSPLLNSPIVHRLLKMHGRRSVPSSHPNGEDVFQELIAKLNRFILPNDITLGQIRGFGGFAEVFEASMVVKQTGASRKVAVKRFRVVLRTATEFAKVLYALLSMLHRFC